MIWGDLIPVVIESPFEGGTDREAINRTYLDCCIGECLRWGEAPVASHKLYVDALNDMVPEERSLGMHAGFVYAAFAAYTVVYTDRGVTPGMEAGLDAARKLHRSRRLRLARAILGLPRWRIVYRQLGLKARVGGRS